MGIDLDDALAAVGLSVSAGSQQFRPIASTRAVRRFTRLRAARSNEHWADASMTIADGRVLVTPVETDQIYCLNLADGKELWKQNRGDEPVRGVRARRAR